MVIGIAGNTGSGKSTVAKILEGFGATVIGADRLGWEALEKKRAEVVEEFGERILSADGTIDRKRLGTIVFSSQAKRRILNEIVHPLLLKRLEKEFSKTDSKEIRVVDAALIFDWGIGEQFDCVVVVTADERVKVRRLMKSGLSYRAARNRLKSQLPEEILREKADYIIENNGSLGTLRQKCRELWSQLVGE